jgi:transposase
MACAGAAGEEADNDLHMLPRHLLAELKLEHNQLSELIERIEVWIKAWHANSPESQRLASIPGIAGLIIENGSAL